MTRRSLLSLPAAALAAMPADEEGFVALFDGRTLDGWTVRDGPASGFYVRDGAISDPRWLGLPYMASIEPGVRELRLPL